LAEQVQRAALRRPHKRSSWRNTKGDTMDYEELIQSGKNNFAAKEYDKAIADYSKAIELDP
jgi:hypothetical protein